MSCSGLSWSSGWQGESVRFRVEIGRSTSTFAERPNSWHMQFLLSGLESDTLEGDQFRLELAMNCDFCAIRMTDLVELDYPDFTPSARCPAIGSAGGITTGGNFPLPDAGARFGDPEAQLFFQAQHWPA